MKSTFYSTIAAAVLSIAALHATPAQAQSRVFVAAQGSDSNPCTFALPCRSFQHAHDTVPAGGEIDVLDPAGYGALTISKAISIQGHGFAGVSVASGNTGIQISAAATDAVNLNGLIVEGSGVGSFGIAFFTGKSLVVENCVVRNIVNSGLALVSLGTSMQTLSVSNSYVTDIGSSGSGITVGTASTGPVTATIERSAVYGNGAGINVNGAGGTGAIDVAVTDTVAGGNGTGITVASSTGHSVTDLVLTRITSSGNTTGIAASGANATLRLTQSTITGNATGYKIFPGGTILSYGDNTIDNNGNNSGTLGSASKQ